MVYILAHDLNSSSVFIFSLLLWQQMVHYGPSFFIRGVGLSLIYYIPTRPVVPEHII